MKHKKKHFTIDETNSLSQGVLASGKQDKY